MLYDFHVYQNAQKAESVHATYLVYGTQAIDKTQQNGDVEMSSSMPEHEEVSEEVPTTTLTLVREEDLKGESSHDHLFNESPLTYHSHPCQVPRGHISSCL